MGISQRGREHKTWNLRHNSAQNEHNLLSLFWPLKSTWGGGYISLAPPKKLWQYLRGGWSTKRKIGGTIQHKTSTIHSDCFGPPFQRGGGAIVSVAPPKDFWGYLAQGMSTKQINCGTIQHKTSTIQWPQPRTSSRNGGGQGDVPHFRGGVKPPQLVFCKEHAKNAFLWKNSSVKNCSS